MAEIHYPKEVLELVGELKRLPGIGSRSAERIAIWMLQHPKGNSASLAEVLERSRKEVVSCGVCGFFATSEGCPSCDATGRDENLFCVVEQPVDVLPIERSGVFRGRYHCLGGRLSPLDDVGPEDLRIPELLERVRTAEGAEVILATAVDVEGEATAGYLTELLKAHDCRVTRLAQGLPAGGGLEFADELTLTRAFEGRKTYL